MIQFLGRRALTFQHHADQAIAKAAALADDVLHGIPDSTEELIRYLIDFY